MLKSKARQKAGGLALLALLVAGCVAKVYTIIDEPRSPLKRFGGVTVGSFSTKDFLDSIENTERREKYKPVTAEANDSVADEVEDLVKGWVGTPGGPKLILTAVLDDYATGSGAMRAMSHFGMFGGNHGASNQLGAGVIEYTVTLKSGTTLVATYQVRVRITGRAAGAYKLTGRNIARFLEDEL